MPADFRIIHGEGQHLDGIEDGSVALIFADPPFSGDLRRRKVQRTDSRSPRPEYAWQDVTEDQCLHLLDELGAAALRCLADDGVLAVLLPPEVAHQAYGVLADHMTPRGEIIWHHELGGTSKRWWSSKHSTILLLDRGGNGRFDHDNVPRVTTRGHRTGQPAERPINSVWAYTWPQSDPDRTGYPSEKPPALIERFVLVHTQVGGLVIDPFCGSGSTGVAALRAGRRFVGYDVSADACALAERRCAEAAGGAVSS